MYFLPKTLARKITTNPNQAREWNPYLWHNSLALTFSAKKYNMFFQKKKNKQNYAFTQPIIASVYLVGMII